MTDEAARIADTRDGRGVLVDMARHRRTRRMADAEWFDVLYRVYLSAITAGLVVLAVAGAIGDLPFDAARLDDIAAHGPSAIGLVVSVLFILSVRSGMNGGPIALEEPDVWHVLTAPIDRGTVLRRPALQRLRAAVFAGLLAGAVAGLLAARRFPEPAAQWVAAGAVSGAALGALAVGTALVAHALRFRRASTSAILTVLLGWQILAVANEAVTVGPFDVFGHLALNPLGGPASHAGAAAGAIATSVAIAACGLVLAGGLSVEALARRGRLVSQLRFAATVQDVRTVLLLRRQLGHEHCRVTPWFRLRGAGVHPTVVRSVRGFAHYPARRAGRVLVLVAAAAAAHVGVAEGTTALAVVAGVALFVAGLDLCESLSQEVDQANLADSFPRERSELFLRHLVAPAIVSVPLLAVAAAVAVALRPGVDTAAMTLIVGPSALLGGFAGSVVNIVRGAPDQVKEANETLFMPPEVSGLTTLIRSAWPPAVSIAAQLPTMAAMDATRDGRDPWSAAGRAALAVGLLVLFIGGWVRQRDEIRRWWAGLRAGTSTSTTS